MSVTGGCKGFTTIAVLEVITGVVLGTLEPSGLLELCLLGILATSTSLDSLQRYFYFSRGFLDEYGVGCRNYT